MNDIELYTTKEVYTKFKAKSERSFKMTLDSLSLQYPNAKCLKRYFGRKRVFSKDDLMELQNLCLKFD